MENARFLISIIVPFYNTKKEYFYELLDQFKLLDKRVEVVLVDDGSNIESSSEIKSVCKTNNFKYLGYEKNKGVSNARNLGLKNISGKYVLFVDSDDLINFKLINKLCNLDLNNDIYLFKDAILLDKTPEIIEEQLNEMAIDESIFEMFAKNNLKLSLRSACNKLIKSSLITDGNLEFDTKLIFYEDSLFVSKLIKNVHSFTAFDNVLYYYRIYNSSSSRKYNKDYFKYYNLYFEKFLKENAGTILLDGLYRDTIKNVLIDKVVLDFKCCKLKHMYSLVKNESVVLSANHLINDNNKVVRKISRKINKKHYFCATNYIIIHQIKEHILFLLSKNRKKTKI